MAEEQTHLPAEEQARRAFLRGVKRRGWEAAVAWFTSPASPCRPELAAAVVARFALENLERVTICQSTLTANRRRPGAFE